MSAPLAVYVHIPFCTVKCGYCDFNAYSGLDNVKDAYGVALLKEVESLGPTLAGRTLTSIGFGGGTPSEVPTTQIRDVIDALAKFGTFAEQAEVSLEANPGTLTETSLNRLRSAGVTRLSLGAQSFSSDELRFLDRIHSPEATAAAVRLARLAGFESVGLDLIYGLPAQETDGWLATVQTAVQLAPDHISTYALTVEEGTPLARRVRRGEVSLPDEDQLADLYEAATDLLQGEGYEQYELSNWARPGHESRHNRTYWTDGDYLGIGAGAHGYLAGERYENLAHPSEYVERLSGPVLEARGAVASRYSPDRGTSMSDWLGLRLRLIEGFLPEAFESRFGTTVFECVGPVLEDCASAGVLEVGPRICLTRRGRLLHGEVAARLLVHINRSQSHTTGVV